MATNLGTRGRIRWVVAAIAITAVASVVMSRIRKPTELAVYTTAADRMVRGEEIYRPTDRKAFTYPPFFAVPFVPLNQFPARFHAPMWWAINLLLIGLSAWLIMRLTAAARQKTDHKGDRGRAALGWGAGITTLLSAKYMLLPLVYGSHDLLILVLMLASGVALAHGRQLSSGLWGGIAAACKATPLLLLPFLIWQRKFWATAMFVAVLMVATVLPDLLFPHPSHRLWVEDWYSIFVAKVHVGAAPDASGAWKEWNELNQSLAGTVHRLATPAPEGRTSLNVALLPLSKNGVKLATLGLDCLVLAFCAWLSWPRKFSTAGDSDDGLLMLGYTSAALCGMLLLSPMSSTYHFCLLLPAIAFLVTYWICYERDWLVGGTLGLQLMISSISGDLFGSLADWALAAGLYTFNAALLLATSGYVLAWRLPRLACQAPPRLPVLVGGPIPSEQTYEPQAPQWRAKAA